MSNLYIQKPECMVCYSYRGITNSLYLSPALQWNPGLSDILQRGIKRYTKPHSIKDITKDIYFSLDSRILSNLYRFLCKVFYIFLIFSTGFLQGFVIKLLSNMVDKWEVWEYNPGARFEGLTMGRFYDRRFGAPKTLRSHLYKCAITHYPPLSSTLR